MGPIENEVNPYQTPGIERLHHTSVYQWPLSADKSIRFELDIDRAQLLKCVENNRSIGGFVISTLVSAIGFLLTGIYWISGNGGISSAFMCISTFMALCYLGPRCSHAWHARRLQKQFYWMWGQVSATINSEGIRWKSKSVEFQHHWDSFYQLTVWPNTVSLATMHPFLMEIPIRREWVGEEGWGDLRQVAEAHKGFNDRQAFWNLARPASVKYREVAAPDNQETPAGAISFRANGLGGMYGTEIAQSISKWNGALYFVGYTMIVLSDSTSFVRQLKASLGISESGTLLYAWLAILCFFSFLHQVLRWFPAGTGLFQWSQTLLSSQSGYVARGSVCVASPACTFHAKLGGEIRLRPYQDCLVLQLHRKFSQSFVIPRDQFAKEHVEAAWNLAEVAASEQDALAAQVAQP